MIERGCWEEMPKKSEITTTSDIVRTLHEAQYRLGLSDEDMMRAIMQWNLDVFTSQTDEQQFDAFRLKAMRTLIAMLKEENYELQLVVAAMALDHHGVLNISRSELEEAKRQASRLVRQYRLDDSGVDIYFFQEPKLK